MLAGCGGGLRHATSQEAGRLLGNSHPKILRVETVQEVGGTRIAVATLEGHFRPIAVSCGLGPCHGPTHRISYAWLNFSVSHPTALAGFGTTSASQLAAIDNARSAKPVFSIFPDFTNPAIRCAIPRGNASGTIAGACTTFFDAGSIDPNQRARSVTFRERWPFVPGRNGRWAHGQKLGGWIVTLDRNSHVRSIRVFGDLPPQLWK